MDLGLRILADAAAEQVKVREPDRLDAASWITKATLIYQIGAHYEETNEDRKDTHGRHTSDGLTDDL